LMSLVKSTSISVDEGEETCIWRGGDMHMKGRRHAGEGEETCRWRGGDM
jgi:hypothetical protein